MDWEWESDEEDEFTAYHEAGHAIVGCALGAHIESVSLSQASVFDDDDSGLPLRFGDCIINWGRVDATSNWQQERELLTILAGPISEATYRDNDPYEIDIRAWQMDFQQAARCVEAIEPSPIKQSKRLQSTIVRLRKVVSNEPIWSAIAALSDELLVGDPVEGDRVAELVRFWMARG